MTMTRAERAELGLLIRKRERVLKHAATERSAAMLADYDAMSAKVCHWDDDNIWAKAQKEAMAAVAAARIAIAARCETLGIPAEFAPSMDVYWSGRGHNAVASRRAELRQAAKSRIAAIEATACSTIERMSLEAQTEIVSQGIESDAAKAFLQALPPIEQLMPMLEMTEVQNLLETRKADQRQRYLQ